MMCNRHLCILLFVTAGCMSSPGIEHSGFSTSALTPTTARWIWAATDHANQWVAFRTKIFLDAAPSTAITQIAADTKYWLYVNGNLVTFEGGLKRGPPPNDSYYDEQDLARYL